MSFSDIAVQQREKETSQLKSFLAFSLICSVALHIGVLAAGMGKLLKARQKEEEPIELSFIEPEIAETPLSIQETKEFDKFQTSPNNQIQQEQPESIVLKRSQPRVNIEASSPTAAQQPQVQQPNTFIPTKTFSQQPSGDRGGHSNSNESDILSGSDPGSTVSLGSGTGNGTGIGNGNGSESTTPSSVATTSITPSLRIDPPASGSQNRNISGSGNGRAACSQCDTNYPEAAKRRGIEGRVEVAVDTDAQGNITNVRLIRSSGNSELDEEHLRQAQKWKLKPTTGGRQGVTIGTEYAIKGSQRYRQIQERKRQTEVAAKNLETAADSNAPVATAIPKRKRRQEQPSSISQNKPGNNQRHYTQPTYSAASNAKVVPTSPKRRRRRVQPSSISQNSPRPHNQPASSTASTGNESQKTSKRRRRREQPLLNIQNLEQQNKLD